MEDVFESNKSVLQSMLLDEEKLITYVSLSKDLCVHVNTSKLLLLRLIDIVRQEKPDLQVNVSYVISGATQNNNARTIVCSEEDLSKQRECFTNIFYEHIYSVSIGKYTIDTAAYLTINKFEDFVLCSGLIKSNQCDRRTSAEIGNLKSISQDIVVPEKSKSLPTPLKKQETDITKNSQININPIIKRNESKSEPVIKQELLSPKKEVLVNSRSKITSTNNHKTQKGIAGFFSNKPSKKEIKEKVPNDEKTGQKNINVEKELSTEMARNEDLVKKENKSNTILNQIKKSSKVDKKRKRVLLVSDSESDNENNDPFMDNSVPEQEQVVPHESDDEIPPTPTTHNIKITSGFLNPKKKRKIVDKTYTGEDGYFVTKREEVYESCSEDEEGVKCQKVETLPVIPVKTEISPKGKNNSSKKKVSPSQKGKQPTLTNFFKKI